jgi:putative transposase
MANTWCHWRTALVLVQPDTVLRWHREWLRRRWTQRSRCPPGGRPTVDQGIRTLVTEMARANPLWGAPRIHGELGKLGLNVSERTMSRLLARRRRPPSQTWRTFLTNHVATMVSMDFFTVSTLEATAAHDSRPARPSTQRRGQKKRGQTVKFLSRLRPIATLKVPIDPW